MSPDYWQKIKLILDDALAQTPAARGEYVAERCGANQTLRRDVESLLAFEKTAGDALEASAFATVEDLRIPENNFVGKTFGNYKILEKLGEGGMGAVFLAARDDGEFSRQVAVKLIRSGIASDAVLRRFLNERQILAELEHPNIARLIDGGTSPDGTPFLAMEYVKGSPIDEYVARKNLSLTERLDLFRRVCAAVAHAHKHLVIHRDLKPSNILVTDDGAPKLLDFGIAKLLKTGNSNDTQTRQFAFTPEYASPEQIKGEKLTTASDVYSLGIILYELLTGNRPYRTDRRNFGEIIQLICDTEPKRPSSVVSRQSSIEPNRTSENNGQKTKDQRPKTNPKSKIQNPKLLKGDLDNIILKALRKEPERRYQSVEQFSEDIRRHLKGLPVTASKATWSYRAAKFMQRNRLGAAAAALVLATLLFGLGTTLYQANIAHQERAKAERRLADVRRLANSFMFEINDQLVKSPIKARELLVQRAVEYLDKLASEAGESDLELQSELATAYEKIGDVQSEAYKPSLGKTSDALLSHQKALEFREKLFAAEPTVERGLSVANSHLRVGDILMMSGRMDKTCEKYREAIRLLESLLISDAGNFTVRRKLASSFALLGQAVIRSGSLNEALVKYEKSMEIFEKLRVENPADLTLERSVGIVFSYIGFVKMETGKSEEAVQCYMKWLEAQKKMTAADENDVVSRGELGMAQTWVGVALGEQGKIQEAIPHFVEGVKIHREIFEADRANFGERHGFADACLEFGKVLVKHKNTTEAIKMLESALTNYQTILQTDRENLWVKHRVAASQRYLADAFLQNGNLKKALENYDQAFAVFRQLTAADPTNSEWQLNLALFHLQMGECYLKTKDKANALANFEQALPIFEKQAADSPENLKRRHDLKTVQSYLNELKS